MAKNTFKETSVYTGKTTWWNSETLLLPFKKPRFAAMKDSKMDSFPASFVQSTDNGPAAAVREFLLSRRFLSMKDDCYTTDFQSTVVDTFFYVMDMVRDALGDRVLRVLSFTPGEAIFLLKDDEIFTVIDTNNMHLSRVESPWDVVSRRIIVRGTSADRDYLRVVQERLKVAFPASNAGSLAWQFVTPHGPDIRVLNLGTPKPTFSEFYPWLTPDLRTYQKRYVESDSSVLILLGAPGSGKTSFIRDLIHTHAMRASFTYDEELLDTDSMFVNFISGDQNLLVIEDADVFLSDREKGGNQKMARFLNVSDGLAAGTHAKKIIFTANILTPTKIDPALLRTGRCFDCQVFRALTFEEAKSAARAAGLVAPTQDKSYTLAELFALGKDVPASAQPERLGFVG